MTIGVVGLGLIGGSLAAAFKKSGHIVLGSDANKTIQDFALLAGSIDAVLDDDLNCDVIFLAVTPKNAIEWMREKASAKSKEAISKKLIIDCCGTKRNVCREGFALAKEYDFTFVGGHPMAGKQVGGYKNSSANLFDGAMFAIVPEDSGAKSDVMLMMRIQSLLKDAGFKEFAVMTADEHDKIIAFTSQMAHLISNAYIKSDMAGIGIGAGLSGGAFRDMTRVAYLDESMWTELFMENRDNMLSELNGFIGELERYRDAIEQRDEKTLTELLSEGKRCKEQITQ